jgi:Putative outer membrane beta-barrel porin, MtrB/PioB
MYNNVSGNGTATPPFGGGPVVTFDQEHVNTVTAAVSYAAIPGKLDFDVRYAISMGVDQQTCLQCSPAYPNDTTLFQRLDATSTYKFDPIWVHQMGFNGDIKFKLRYTWERNAVNNWQNDSLAPFTPFLNSATSSFLWLAYDNPNYNVQTIAASLIASW